MDSACLDELGKTVAARQDSKEAKYGAYTETHDTAGADQRDPIQVHIFSTRRLS